MTQSTPIGGNSRNALKTIIGFSRLSSEEYDNPLVIVRGQGARVYDAAGADYIEATSNFYAASFGFNEPELLEAACEQMSRIANFSTLQERASEPVLRLGEEISRRVPMEDARVGFATSGSEANEFVLKFLQLRNAHLGQPGRRTVISRWGGYHGSTMATTSLGGNSFVQAAYALDSGERLFLSQPDMDEFGRPGESVESFSARLIAELESVLAARGAERVSAFIAEPVSVASGGAVPTQQYWDGIQRVLRAHGIPFVADEVVTGFGRLGKLFGSNVFGLSPDVMTFAKGINSGYLPISAYAISGPLYEEIVDATRVTGTLMHGGVYHGNPVSAAVALKCLELYERRNIEAHTARMGDQLEREIRKLEGHPLVLSCRRVGMIGSIKFDKGRLGHGKAPGIGAEVVRAALSHRLIVRVTGGSIHIAPPLVVTEEEMTELFRRLNLALASVLDARTRQGLVHQ